jgi:outer membrane receptor for ferrienterochelin and colicins
MLDQYRESYNDSAFTRLESVPGIFTEYHYELPHKFSLLGGLRLDYHNLYGVLVNPRLHLKIHLKPLTLFRLSAGRGLRVANVIAENQSVMASSRRVSVQPGLRPEVAWNYGITFTHKHLLFKRSATWNLDFFRTDFINQVVADLDQHVQQISFYNLEGKSFSNAFQAEFSWEVKKRVEVRAAYKWQDAKTNYHGELMARPFVSSHRVLLNMAYATKFEKWKFDLTPKWFGRSRIPVTMNHTTHEEMKSWSDPYFLLNAQLTRAFKRWDLYVGVENITNFMQHHQILSKDEPFGPFFDASLIWGPVMGRVLYTGLRLSIK